MTPEISAEHPRLKVARLRATPVGCGCPDAIAPHKDDNPRLLWIDDEIQITDPCVRLLRLEGYCVDCASSGSAALLKLQSTVYDAVILDLRLQDESGLDVLATLRACGLTSPILVLTAWADWESGVAAMKRGAWDYQSKTTMLTDEWIGIVQTMVALSRIRCERHPALTESPATLQAHDLTILTRLETFAASAATPAAGEAQLTSGREVVVGLLLSALIDASVTLPVFLAVAESVRRMLAASPSESVADRCVNACGVIRRAGTRDFACRHPKVKEALAQLEAHPQRWAEEDLARTLGVSASHFGRVVHHDTGLSYRDLRRAATLKPAIREILLTDEHVAQIGLRLGFQHPSQFTREVHETFGLSPRQLRRLWKQVAAHSEQP